MKNEKILSFEIPDSEEKLKALTSITKAKISLVGIYGRLLFKPSDWIFTLGDNNLIYDVNQDILQMTINLYQEDLLLEIEKPRGFTIYGGVSLEIKKASKITFNGNIETPIPNIPYVFVME